ncbi:hypothetical protein H5P28_17050 [Ruficoccus amylovorans]|uniref:DNRLRE domain-containing protein n=1 Tax=Ruficoccus amylovorans TaxID=1804625 RepID=A0A842HKA6_9BACT|nr:hypothetical protein [Ruficoccus amylovorans]MBC2595976.1 hypothetical protein [Ruficoccus amylovorans]
MKMSSWKFVVLMSVLALPLVGQADNIVLDNTTGDSSTLMESLPNDVTSSVDYVSVRRRNISGSERNNIGAFKFELPSSVAAQVTEATLSFCLYKAAAATTTVYVYGLSESASKGPVTEANWSDSTITYNTMPGLYTADGNLQNQSVNTAEATLLGSIDVEGGTASMSTITLSTEALAQFLNSVSNGSVTFLLETRLVGSGRDEELQILSGQRSSSGSGSYPTLELTMVPEPAASGLILMAAVFVLLFKRMRRARCS